MISLTKIIALCSQYNRKTPVNVYVMNYALIYPALLTGEQITSGVLSSIIITKVVKTSKPPGQPLWSLLDVVTSLHPLLIVLKWWWSV